MSRSPDPGERRAERRTFWVVLAGVLLVQLAWILVLPAFAGIDEFDHVYKADAVAEGQLGHDGAADAGRGGLLRVSDDIVEAASATCDSYFYTGHDNCHADRVLGGGLVAVASGAATYNPAYYAVVGTLARPFEGVDANLVMRLVTSLLTGLLIAWAAKVTQAWSRNRWPLLCLPVGTTPVLAYSAAVAAPNGVGYAAAILLWAAGIAAVRAPERPPLPALVVAAATMLLTHTTGVIWLGISVAVLATLLPAGEWCDRAWSNRGPRERGRILLATCAVLVTALGCVGWILAAGTNALNPEDESIPPLRLASLLAMVVLWFFQAVGAFPMRNDPAPLVVYALWLTVVAVVLVLGVRTAARRIRLALALLLGGWLTVPLALTIVAYPSEGFAWQGRYALSLAVGFIALAAHALNRGRGPSAPAALLMLTALATAHATSVAAVARHFREWQHSPALADTVPGGVILAVLLALAGGLLPALLLVRRPAESPDDAREHALVNAPPEGRTP